MLPHEEDFVVENFRIPIGAPDEFEAPVGLGFGRVKDPLCVLSADQFVPVIGFTKGRLKPFLQSPYIHARVVGVLGDSLDKIVEIFFRHVFQSSLAEIGALLRINGILHTAGRHSITPVLLVLEGMESENGSAAILLPKLRSAAMVRDSVLDALRHEDGFRVVCEIEDSAAFLGKNAKI